MRKCQISFDFLVIVVFTFLLYLAMFEAYSLESTSARISEAKISALRVGSIVARAIDRVARENGSSTSVIIPESLDTSDTYYLRVTSTGRRVDVFWPISAQNRSIGVALLTSNVSEPNISQSKGSGQLTLSVTNLNGFVNIGCASSIYSACNGFEFNAKRCSDSSGGTSGALDYYATCCNTGITSAPSCFQKTSTTVGWCGDGHCDEGEDCETCRSDCRCGGGATCCECDSGAVVCFQRQLCPHGC